MFNVVLVAPEIPPNTGNAIRLCANTGAQLHLVRPLGFDLSDKQLRRAGLDYHEYAALKVHDSWAALQAAESPDPARMFALTTRGSAMLGTQRFAAGDWFVFGCETSGLPAELRE
nr:tRNA (uridine(34)/cytosine(34)/5-carboxymethylaminomethyluridine(34)-2'-O)-methyltransferase TrmL [Burkholderiaceae bacterium]